MPGRDDSKHGPSDHEKQDDPAGRPYTIEHSPFGRIYVPNHVPPGIALFYTTRDFDGYLNEDSFAKIRNFILERFGIDAELYTCNQVHGTKVFRVATRDPRPGSADCDTCDALWSELGGAALGIKVADCLPVTLVDGPNGVIANVHSGWRGTAEQITSRTLTLLREQSSFDPRVALAFLGPSIRSCCFEVGEEVAEQFSGFERYVLPGRGAHRFIDLPGLTMEMLVAGGIPRQSVMDSGLCTRCNGSDFHSYRREKGSGRNLAVVAR